MRQRAVFLDLNGTLVMPIKPNSLSELTLIEHAEQAIAHISHAGFLCPVVTVQSRINKGIFSMGEFQLWFTNFARDLTSRGAFILGPYVCPHRFKEPCECKKPSTFLYQQAAADHGIDLQRSFVIGDSAEDVLAACQFGGQGCLVRTGWAVSAFIAESLGGAADWILAQT